MKLDCESRDLIDPLRHLANVTDKRHRLPILAMAYLEAIADEVILVGSDLEVELVFCLRLPVEREGRIAFPARKLLEICRIHGPDSRIVLEAEGERLLVRIGNSRYRLTGGAAEGYPRLIAGGERTEIAIPAPTLRTLLERAAFAMAVQDVRFYLNGLLLDLAGEEIRAVASDGHRMAFARARIDGGGGEIQIILPRKGALELQRLIGDAAGEVRIGIGKTEISFQEGDRTLISKLVEGRYPDYHLIMDQERPIVAVMEREALRQVLARVVVVGADEYRGVRLRLEPGVLRLEAGSAAQDEAVEEIPVEYTGETLEFGVRAAYLQDVCNSIHGDRITMELDNPGGSLRIRAEEGMDLEKYIIMPFHL
jgi:DNA polymerase-3 subunit beta